MKDNSITHLQQKSLQLYFKQLVEVFNSAGYTVPFVIKNGVDLEWNKMFVKELMICEELVPEMISSKNKEPDNKEKEVNELFEYYKKKITFKTVKTKLSHQKIKRRLQEKPIEENITRFEELKKAIDMFSGNIWRMNNNRNQGLQFFFKSEDQIVKWLSLSQDKGGSKVIIIGDKK